MSSRRPVREDQRASECHRKPFEQQLCSRHRRPAEQSADPSGGQLYTGQQPGRGHRGEGLPGGAAWQRRLRQQRPRRQFLWRWADRRERCGWQPWKRDSGLQQCRCEGKMQMHFP